MKNRIEDLWQKMASDGASTPLGIDLISPRAEIEDLMHAWLRERGQSIELAMLLKRSRQLISRLASADCVSEKDRKRAKDLLIAIEHTLRKGDSGEG